MLGRDPELSADMMAAELLKEGPVGIRHQIVKTNARADKDSLNSRKGAQLPKELNIVRVVYNQVRAGLREKALAVYAGPAHHLFVAGRPAKLRSGASDVIDIALKVRILRHEPGLREDGLMASCLHDPSLVEGQRTEAAAAVAAAVGGKGEFNVVAERGDASLGIIHRMPRTHVGKGVDIIQFLRCQGPRRRVLHHKGAAVIGFIDALCSKGIRVFVLELYAERAGLFAAGSLFIIGKADGVVNILLPPCLPDGPVYVGDIPHIDARGQSVGDLDDAQLAHAIGDQVRAGLQKDGPSDAL